MGVPLLSGQEKALELYKHIIKNAPYGTYGDQAQFQIGEIYKAQGEYEEAKKAYQAVVDDYPQSDLVAKSRYQIAYCAMLASHQYHYNEEQAEQAIEEFESFRKSFPTEELALEAEESIRSLRAERAETGLDTAEFYERLKKYKSARVYYEQIVASYPETPAAEIARHKINKIDQRESEPKKSGFKFRLW